MVRISVELHKGWLSVQQSPARAPPMIRISVELQRGRLSVQQSPATSPPMIRISVELQKGWLSVQQSPARASRQRERHQWSEYLVRVGFHDCLYNSHQLERHQWLECLFSCTRDDCLYNSPAQAPPMIRISVELHKEWLSVQQSPAKSVTNDQNICWASQEMTVCTTVTS